MTDNKTRLCPYCHLPQPVRRHPSDPPGEVYCPNCGGPWRWGRGGAVRPTTVLWIDDDRLLLSACGPLLERHGYRVLCATDGVAGLATARKERPDAILLDVLMPTRNGLEICQQLRADPALQGTPIILLTALDDPGIGALGAQAGATATFRKPFGPEHIVAFLEKTLGRPEGPPRL